MSATSAILAKRPTHLPDDGFGRTPLTFGAERAARNATSASRCWEWPARHSLRPEPGELCYSWDAPGEVLWRRWRRTRPSSRNSRRKFLVTCRKLPPRSSKLPPRSSKLPPRSKLTTLLGAMLSPSAFKPEADIDTQLCAHDGSYAAGSKAAGSIQPGAASLLCGFKGTHPVPVGADPRGPPSPRACEPPFERQDDLSYTHPRANSFASRVTSASS